MRVLQQTFQRLMPHVCFTGRRQLAPRSRGIALRHANRPYFHVGVASPDLLCQNGERHATSLSKPDCPICSGMRWVFVAEEGTVGGVKVYPRYCLFCGYTMFAKAELLG
jgi:hypothetical protein